MIDLTPIMTFWRIVAAILNNAPELPALVMAQPSVLRLSLSIVLLAGLSEAIGQSVVLFVNEIPPRRFVLSLLLSALLFTLGYVLWVFTLWGLALMLPLVQPIDIRILIRAAGLGYAPLLFGFLAVIPYFGSIIQTLLYFWAFTIITRMLTLSLGISLAEAVLISLAGGLLVLVMRATLGRPLVMLLRRLRNVIAGKKLILKIQQAVEQRSLAVFDPPPDADPNEDTRP